MDYRLLIVIIFTGVIHFINTLGYSVRLSGVRTRSLAIANSMWNVIFLVSSTANTIQGPFLGKIIDQAGKTVKNAMLQNDITQINNITSSINTDLRLAIVAATIGSVLGVLIIPTFVTLFIKGIERFNKVGSVPRLLISVMYPKNIWRILKTVKNTSIKEFYRNNKNIVPYKILIFNMVIWGLFTTSILSAMFAGVLVPDFRTTTSVLASIVNGVATVLLFIMVDPYISAITDQALRGERTVDEVKSVTVYMAVSRAIGTLLAQMFFVPAAYIIMYVAKII